MSILANSIKEYTLVPKDHLFELNCKVRDVLQTKIRLNFIIDFDDFPCSKIKVPGIKDYFIEVDNDTKSLIVLEPNNFPEVCYLNLAESTFIHFKNHEDSFSLKLPLVHGHVIRSEFDETCNLKLAAELLRRMAEIPHSISLQMKKFLKFSRISGCIGEKEKLPISRILLNAMYLQEQELGSDGNLTVEILKTFCSSDEMKKSMVMVIGGYSYELLDYIFRCCTAVEFDIEKYLTYGKLTSFCPVTICITSPLQDLGVLRILLQHGFEIQGHSLREYGYFHDEMLGDWRHLLYEGPLMQLSIRRQNILLFLLHIVYASLRRPQFEWVDSIKLVFNSIPDPCICEPDLRLYKSRNFRHYVLTHFKGSYTTSYLPRTLKHLSRCFIRKVLKLNFKLPNGISALPLPLAEQSYLKHLED